MANPKSTITPLNPAPQHRPLNPLFTALFAIIAGAGFYLVHIDSKSNNVPFHFQDRVDTARHEDGTPLKTVYTGVPAIDVLIPWVVVAFAAGPLGFDDGVRLQQIHFLVSFFGVLCVWNVEAYRKRNAGRLISFPGTFGFFYQTVAGAVVMPLYHLFYTLTSTDESYLDSGRALPLPAAKAILPSAVLVYLLPTIVVYLPLHNASLTQSLIAFWQITPMLASAAIWLLFKAQPRPSRSAAAKGQQDATAAAADIKHLARIYATAFLVCAATHIAIVTICLTSPNPQTSLARVFLPDRATWQASTALGLHWIFQVDWWGTFVASLLWCWMAAGDVQRRLTGTAQYGKTLVVIVAAAVVVGPGAVQAGVWWWREGKMAEVEGRVRSKKA